MKEKDKNLIISRISSEDKRSISDKIYGKFGNDKNDLVSGSFDINKLDIYKMTFREHFELKKRKNVEFIRQFGISYHNIDFEFISDTQSDPNGSDSDKYDASGDPVPDGINDFFQDINKNGLIELIDAYLEAATTNNSMKIVQNVIYQSILDNHNQYLVDLFSLPPDTIVIPQILFAFSVDFGILNLDLDFNLPITADQLQKYIDSTGDLETLKSKYPGVYSSLISLNEQFSNLSNLEDTVKLSNFIQSFSIKPVLYNLFLATADPDPDTSEFFSTLLSILTANNINPFTIKLPLTEFSEEFENDSTYELDLNQDHDGDGLSSLNEYIIGYNPIKIDTNDDGIPDGDHDADKDGIPNKLENNVNINIKNRPVYKDLFGFNFGIGLKYFTDISNFLKFNVSGLITASRISEKISFTTTMPTSLELQMIKDVNIIVGVDFTLTSNQYFESKENPYTLKLDSKFEVNPKIGVRIYDRIQLEYKQNTRLNSSELSLNLFIK